MGATSNNAEEDRALGVAVAVPENLEVVEELLNWHPQMNLKNQSGMTVLETALPNLRLVEALLNAGANPDLQNDKGDTLFTTAVDQKLPEIVELLIRKGVDIHHKGSSGLTPIQLAVQRGSIPIVRLLAENGARLGEVCDEDGQSLFHLARSGPPDLLRFLLEFRKIIDINHRDRYSDTPLLRATTSDRTDLECLKLLIRAGADINICDEPEGDTPLHNTAWCDKIDFASILLAEPDIDVNRRNKTVGTALHIACYMSHVTMVTQLLDAGADVNILDPEEWCTPLIAALLPRRDLARTDGTRSVDQMVRTLVRRGADVNLAPKSLNPILAACIGAGVNTINFLLDEGASCQAAEPVTGRMPIHYAAINGIENFEAILLAYRGDMMVSDNSGKNALHWAAQFGNSKTVEFIVSKLKDRAPLNAADHDGWTPLCWAMRPNIGNRAEGMRSESQEYEEVVRYLLENQVDPQVTFQYTSSGNVETLTPLIMARRCQASQNVIEMLEEAISKRPNMDGVEIPAIRGRYRASDWSCDYCLNGIYGFIYECQSCPSYVLCGKCVTSVDTHHSTTTISDGLPHAFCTRYDTEFEDQTLEWAEEQKAVMVDTERNSSQGDDVVEDLEDEMDIEDYI